MSSASTSYVLARVKNRILNETFADLINLNQSDYSAHVELTIGDKSEVTISVSNLVCDLILTYALG